MCADCGIDAEISTVQFIVDVVSFVGGFVGDCAVRKHHVDSVVSPRATDICHMLVDVHWGCFF